MQKRKYCDKMAKGKGKSLTKSQMIRSIQEKTDLTKSQVESVFDTLSDIIFKELKDKRPVSIYGLFKVVIKHKAATKQRVGINNITGKETVFKAKPACDVVKVKPLKGLKEMVGK